MRLQSCVRLLAASCVCAPFACRQVSGRAEPAGRPTDAPSATLAPGRAPPIESASVAPVVTGSSAELLTWRFESSRLGPMVVVVRVPAHTAGQRLPVLFAFHGRGEALKGAERGARGWLDDYHLEHAIERLHAPPLTAEDFGGDVAPERLAEHNLRLARAPFKDLVIVMPFVPDALGRDQVFWAGPVLGDLVEEELVPRIAKETPGLPPGPAWAVDGVSMGGRAALAVGFNRPDLFGVVGGLQAAVDEKELARFVSLAARAHATHPEQRIRLLTSDGDYYLDVNHQLKRRLQAAGLTVQFIQAKGGHNYQFNRGPGVFEMLLDVDGALNAVRP